MSYRQRFKELTGFEDMKNVGKIGSLMNWVGRLIREERRRTLVDAKEAVRQHAKDVYTKNIVHSTNMEYKRGYSTGADDAIHAITPLQRKRKRT